MWNTCGVAVAATAGAVSDGVAERKCASQLVLKSSQPTSADGMARIISGQVMAEGDS